jgi:hypothetical protein
MLPKKARILLASAERAYTRLFSVLPDHELTYVRNFTDAETALKADGFDLIMIGSRFDEARMFDLLRFLKADSKYSEIPVICFRGLRFSAREDESLLRIVEMACKEMGASCFVDLAAFPHDEAGDGALRNVIDRLLSVEQNPRARV